MVHVTLVKPTVMQKKVGKHNVPTKNSEISKHLPNNTDHYFTWTIISNATNYAKTRKN